jgi:hypothetical protein
LAEPQKHAEQAKPAAAKSSGDDAGQAELQAAADEVAEKGHYGETPDDTPNENYSLETPPDAPTPENTRVHPDKE